MEQMEKYKVTPSEEAKLSKSDRQAWIAFVSPRMAASLSRMDDEAIARTWPTMGRDYQTAVWPLLSAEDQARVRKVRAA